MADAFEVLRLPANSVVFQQGQAAQGLFLLVQGRAVLVRTVNGKQQVIGEVHANQYVGEDALFHAANERMSMRVTSDSILLFLPRLRFLEVLVTHPEIRDILIRDYPQLAAYAPETFNRQREDEKLLIQQRRHPWTYIRGSFLPIIVGTLLLAVAFAVSTVPALTLLMAMGAIVLTIVWIYYVYVEWRNDSIIVTDKRVIHIEKTILAFEEHVNEVPISSVHEVNYVIPPVDPFARVFNYGTIFIKTAGESGNMTLTLVPNPREIQQLIITNQLNFNRVVENRTREAISAQIERVLNPNAPQQTAETQTEAEEKPFHGPGPGFLSTRFVDEQGHKVYRKHLSVWLTQIFLPLMGIIASVVIAFASLFASSTSSLGFVGLLPAGGLLFISAMWLYWADWDWRNDMLVIGSSTVRLVHRRPLWLEDRNQQFLLSRVDSVTAARDGVVNTLLNRGDVRISLVGDDIPKVFSYVSHPYQVQDEIAEQRAAVLAGREEEERDQYREDIINYLDVYHEKLRQQSPNPPQGGYAYNPPVYPTQPEPPPQPPPADRDGPRPPRIPRTRDGQ